MARRSAAIPTPHRRGAERRQPVDALTTFDHILEGHVERATSYGWTWYYAVLRLTSLDLYSSQFTSPRPCRTFPLAASTSCSLNGDILRITPHPLGRTHLELRMQGEGCREAELWAARFAKPAQAARWCRFIRSIVKFHRGTTTSDDQILLQLLAIMRQRERKLLPILSYTYTGDRKRRYGVRAEIADGVEGDPALLAIQRAARELPRVLLELVLRFAVGGRIAIGDRPEAELDGADAAAPGRDRPRPAAAGGAPGGAE